MRTGLMVAFLLGSAAVQASEPLVVPAFVKYFGDLDEAKKEAAETHRGLTFLLMEPGST